MRLFTIGDSISQGFMSLGAARTQLAYSTWIAHALGVDVGDALSSPAYRVPDYPAHGLLLDLEVVLRRLQLAFGATIDRLEWAAVLLEINRVLDVAEEYYERGEGAGRYRGGSVPWFHNVSVYGFDVADAWLVTPRLCRERIAAAPGARDGFFQGPNAAFYRTALRVLNPSRDERLDGYSQLDWLGHHARGEGVENLLLWLGPNNAVGSAILLSVAATEDRPERRPASLSFDERTRAQWNLWMPDDFVAEYGELLDRVDTLMRRNESPGWRVFVANVPHVTIVPIATGVGDPLPGLPRYYPYYTYPPLARGTRLIEAGAPHLTAADARRIDETVDACNAQLVRLIEEKNARHRAPRYHLVDVSGGLDRLAYRRTGGEPAYEFPAYFAANVAPPMDTRFYHVDRAGRRRAGGIVSLDGVHPSVIGQGLLAHEFLKVMKEAGVPGADPDRLPWPRIVASDTLYQDPIPLMEEIYQYEELSYAVLSAYRYVFGGFQGRRGSIKDF
ncbi:hypothetical protein WME95_35455 [Sorangium sp. So ce327]|uniref:hypothetical protein n=1 Tax=Sorangium sp. So ce327 TaxID=3133301 RepID=UPI003F5E619C